MAMIGDSEQLDFTRSRAPIAIISKMPRFLTGDELGNVKTLRYSPDAPKDTAKVEGKTIHKGNAENPVKAIQKLALLSASGSKLVR